MTARLVWRILRRMFMVTLVGVVCYTWDRCDSLEKQNGILEARIQTLDEQIRSTEGILLRSQMIAQINSLQVLAIAESKGLPPWGLDDEEGAQ